MTKQDARALSRRLIKSLPGFQHRDFMLYETPVSHILRGFCFDDSRFDRNAFYVSKFFLPLYVPQHVLSLSFGDRIGGGSGKRWNLQEPFICDELLACMLSEGIPFFESVRTPGDVPEAILNLHPEPGLYDLEAIAYSYLMVGRLKEAMRTLTRLQDKVDKRVPWQVKISERAMRIQEGLRCDASDALRQLGEWEQYSKKCLKLE